MYCTNIATENWTTWLSFAGELGFFVKNIRSLSSIDSIETVYLCEREGRVEPSGSTIYICICAICVTKTINHVAVLSNLDVVLSNYVVVLSTHDAVLSSFSTSTLFSRLRIGTLEASETDFDTWHLTPIMTPASHRGVSTLSGITYANILRKKISFELFCVFLHQRIKLWGVFKTYMKQLPKTASRSQHFISSTNL